MAGGLRAGAGRQALQAFANDVPAGCLFLSEVVLHDGPSPAQPINQDTTQLGRRCAPRRSTGTCRCCNGAVPTWMMKCPVLTRARATQGTGTSGDGKHLIGIRRRRLDPPGAEGVSDHRTTDDHGRTWSSSVAASLVRRGDPRGLRHDRNEELAPELIERRHVREEDVELEWQLSWNAGRLDIKSLRPADRSPVPSVHRRRRDRIFGRDCACSAPWYLLEDPLLREQLHTPFLSEVVNQIVFVPEEFFTAEREALERGEKLWHDFVNEVRQVDHAWSGHAGGLIARLGRESPDRVAEHRDARRLAGRACQFRVPRIPMFGSRFSGNPDQGERVSRPTRPVTQPFALLEGYAPNCLEANSYSVSEIYGEEYA